MNVQLYSLDVLPARKEPLFIIELKAV